MQNININIHIVDVVELVEVHLLEVRPELLPDVVRVPTVLFDLKNDPLEKVDLSATEPSILAEMESALAAALATQFQTTNSHYRYSGCAKSWPENVAAHGGFAAPMCTNATPIGPDTAALVSTIPLLPIGLNTSAWAERDPILPYVDPPPSFAVIGQQRRLEEMARQCDGTKAELAAKKEQLACLRKQQPR